MGHARFDISQRRECSMPCATATTRGGSTAPRASAGGIRWSTTTWRRRRRRSRFSSPHQRDHVVLLELPQREVHRNRVDVDAAVAQADPAYISADANDIL